MVTANDPSDVAGKPRWKWRPRFGLRLLFLVMTLVAWCTWQWTISQQRRSACQELEQCSYYTYYNATIQSSGLKSICGGLFLQGYSSETTSGSAVGGVVGWENWRGITVLVPGLRITELSPQQLRKNQIAMDALLRLPGLTEVVIWDDTPGIDEQPAVIEFKKKLNQKRPNVKITHFRYTLFSGTPPPTPVPESFSKIQVLGAKHLFYWAWPCQGMCDRDSDSAFVRCSC